MSLLHSISYLHHNCPPFPLAWSFAFISHPFSFWSFAEERFIFFPLFLKIILLEKSVCDFLFTSSVQLFFALSINIDNLWKNLVFIYPSIISPIKEPFIYVFIYLRCTILLYIWHFSLRSSVNVGNLWENLLIYLLK